jgi:uncharacterized protein (TIGR00304 family)
MKIIYKLIGLLLLLLGIAILCVAVLSGAMTFGIFVIFPFLLGTGILAGLSIIFIFFGIFILFISIFFENIEVDKSKYEIDEGKSKFGGFVLVGPFPIVFGSDKKIVYISIALLIVFIVLLEIYLFFRF